MSANGLPGMEPNPVPHGPLPTRTSGHGWRTAIGTLQFLAAQAVVLVLGFALSIALTRGLGPERYGLYSVAVSVMLWTEMSITSIFYQPSVKFLAEADHWEAMASAVARTEFTISVGAALLLAILAAPLASWLQAPQLAPYLCILALSLPITGLTSVHRSALVARGAFGRSTLPSLFYWPARLLLAMLFLRQGWSVWAGIWGLIGAAIVESAVARLLMRLPLLQPASFPLRRFLTYSVPLFLNSMGIRLLTRVDLLLVQALAGAAAAGFYGAAHNLSLIPLGFLSSALSSPLLATLSRLGKDPHQEEARSIIHVALRFLICLLPIAGLVAGAAPQLVALLYGTAFLPTAPMLAWLIFGALALTVVGVCGALLTAAGKPGWTLPLTAPLLPAAALAHWLLIPRFGAVSAAAVTSVAAVLGAVACLLAVARVWRIRLPLRTAARSALLAMLAYALGGLWPLTSAALLLKLALFAAVIVLAFVALGELSTEELRQLRALAHTRNLFASLWRHSAAAAQVEPNAAPRQAAAGSSAEGATDEIRLEDEPT